MAEANRLHFTAHFPDLPDGLLGVVSFTLEDHLCEPFLLTLELASQDGAITPADVLDGPAMLVIWQGGEPVREVRGVVTRFQRGDPGHHRRRYTLEVRPAMARLELLRNSRIFQEDTADAIIRTLLEERGIHESRFELDGDLPERAYCVQHRETDLDFLQRLAAESGLTYRFDHQQSNSAAVFESAFQSAPELGELRYEPTGGGRAEGFFIRTLKRRYRVAESRVLLTDYDFLRPDFRWSSERDAELAHQGEAGEYFDHTGRFVDDGDADARARHALETLRRDALIADGESTASTLMPGAVFTLQAPADDGDGSRWRVVGVEHHGKQPQVLQEEAGGGGTTYSNDFQSIPADQPWRPCAPERPRRPGTQVAVVTGPDGERVHCDEHGRVQVRFPWDRYGNPGEPTGAWLRVAQGWAGPGYGMSLLPRVGDEVLVSFIDGDPDRPVITGRTYNGINRPPHRLPDELTRTAWRSRSLDDDGYNELVFEDRADAQQILLHAHKNLVLFTGHDRTETIGHDHHASIENNAHQHTGGDEHLSVTGECREHIGGDLSEAIDGDCQQQTGQSLLSEAGQEVHYKAGNKVVIDAGTELTIDAGGSFFKLDPSGVTLMGPTLKLNSGGAPGEGSGVSLNDPEMPKHFEPKAPERVEVAALEEVASRPPVVGNDQVKALRNAAKQGKGVSQVCENTKQGAG